MTSIDSLRLMHYQAEPLTLDRSRVYTQHKRLQFTKPVGFWVSVQGDTDWPSWCRIEEFRVDTLAVAHEVRLRDSANIRTITSIAEIDAFHHEFTAPSEFDIRMGYDRSYWGINWPAVVQQYDGVIITPYLWERRSGGGCDWYYTWDCASGCIWNLDAIESVTVVAEEVAA